MNREEIEGERTKSSDLSGLYHFFPPPPYTAPYRVVSVWFGLALVLFAEGAVHRTIRVVSRDEYIYIYLPYSGQLGEWGGNSSSLAYGTGTLPYTPPTENYAHDAAIYQLP